MSIKRLNSRERGIYFLGEAVIRQMEKASRDPDTEREIRLVWNWVEYWLTQDEMDYVMPLTGIVSEFEFD